MNFLSEHPPPPKHTRAHTHTHTQTHTLIETQTHTHTYSRSKTALEKHLLGSSPILAYTLVPETSMKSKHLRT